MRCDVVICGAGLAGLAAAHAFGRAGRDVLLLERETHVGGLARTLEHRGHRFDLGGHRIITDSARVADLLHEVVREPLLRVPRSSQILLHGRRVDYPLRPLNAVAGLGVASIARILGGYVAARLDCRAHCPPVSLEDWVLGHYGRPLFEMFFKPYSEKVWGLPCDQISADWVAQRIQGLSLAGAIRRSLAAWQHGGPRTLATEFLYPACGIGGVAEGLRAAIAPQGRVHTECCVTRLVHRGEHIEHVVVRHDGRDELYRAADFVSSLPLPALARSLWPPAPAPVIAAASQLRFRDLLLVALRLACERATGQSWIYLPQRELAFGRVHEPRNWSPHMGVPGETLLVAEHFCRRGDRLWQAADGVLIEQAISELTALGLVRRSEVIDGQVVRVPNAYPVFEVGYAAASRTITDYLAGFRNLRIVGRTGAFCYLNMDHAIESGLAAADAVLAQRGAPPSRLPRTGTGP